MKAMGMVRKVDALGRIVLPAEIRETLGVREKDSIMTFAGKNICKACRAKISELN